MFIPPVFAQTLSLGVVTGASVTDDFRSGSTTFPAGISSSGVQGFSTLTVSSGSNQFIIGPKVELSLHWHLAIEVDALHREFTSTTVTSISPPLQLPNGTTISSFGAMRQIHTTWEFPILAKRQFSMGKLNPFVEAGLSLRPAGTGSGLSHEGITVGGGVALHLRSLNIAPTVRYTRWAAENDFFLHHNVNQVELVVGIDQAPQAGRLGAFGLRPSIGIVAGAGLTGGFPAKDGFSSDRSFLAGLALEFKARRHWSVEVDGLYKRLILSEAEREPVLTWEFPILAKYTFPIAHAKPFLESGPSFRAIGNLNSANPSHYGVTAGAGLDLPFWKLTFAPTVRYTHWQADRNAETPSSPNQVELLFALSF